MKLVLSGVIDDSLRHEVARLAGSQTASWLHERALRFDDIDPPCESQVAVARLCEMAKVDHAFMDSSARFSNMRLLAMDMDSTLITIECIDEMADLAGRKPGVASITEAAMRGEIQDFADSLRRRVALLEGVDVDVMRRVYDERLRLTDGASALIERARSEAIETLLVSGGFTYFTDRLQQRLGLDAAFANTLAIDTHRLTGKLSGPILDAQGKAKRVVDAIVRLRCTPQEVVVIGDGANDIPMMETVGHSIAYRAKPMVRAVARYAINYGDLNTAVDFFT